MATHGEQKRAIARHYEKDGAVAYWRDVYVGQWDSIASYAVVRRRELVLRLVDLRARDGSRTVDVGCGSGALMVDLLNRGHRVAGLDISEKMVQASREAMDTQFPGRGTCVVGDVDALPFEAGSFDCAVSVGVLSHQADPRRAVAELCRVVDDDGFVVVTLANLVKLQLVLDPYAWIAMAYRLVVKLVPSSGGAKLGVRQGRLDEAVAFRKYHLGEVGAILEGSGLTIREIIPCTFGPLSFWGKDILPLPTSERLSRSLERVAVRRGFGFLRIFANQWVISLDKSGRHDKR